MYKPLLLILLTILVSCRPKQQIEGIWDLTKNDNHYSNRTVLLDFSFDSLSIVKIGSDEHGLEDTVIIDKFSYNYNESEIIVLQPSDTLTFHVIYINNDSLEFRIEETDETHTLTRLPSVKGEEINKGDFIGKAYRILSGEFYSIADFVSDTVVFLGNYRSFDNWALVQYKDYTFLSTKDFFLKPIPVFKSNNGLTTVNFVQGGLYKFHQFSAKRKQSELYGKWIEYERSLSPPAFPRPDSLQTITINKDSISIERYGRSRKYLFEMNAENTVIHFAHSPYRGAQFWNTRPPLEIMGIKPDTLVVLEKFQGDSTIIKYKKAGNNR